MSQLEYHKGHRSPQGEPFLLFLTELICFNLLGVKPILRRLQYSALTLDHLVEMSHSAHANIDANDTPSFWLVLETGFFASYTSLSLIMYF